MIEADPDLKGRVKVIGIGIGNTNFEVSFFRKTYGIPFPLFPDGEYVIHKQIGQVRTPFFIILKIPGDGTHRIVYAKLGGFKKPEAFLSTIRERAGL